MALRVAVLLTLLSLAACVTEGAEGRAASSQPLPAGAIEVAEDFYMVPLDRPVSGCQAYRAFSRTKRVLQAIYYRTADGRFVTDRKQADCP